MSFPYSSATAGKRAMMEIEKLLRKFECSKFGTFEDYKSGTVTIQFEHRDRVVQLEASAARYAAAWLQTGEITNKERALQQGEKAVYSMLRDWIKGQLTAIECGLMPFEHVFMPYMLTSDGSRVLDHMTPLIEGPKTDEASGSAASPTT